MVTNSTETHDRELEVLQHIASATHVRQRDIAEIVGMSLGMTNAILKRLARKGLITIRKVNNRNIMYAVSPDGFEEIARRSYRYLRRTIRNVVVYKETIESLVALVAAGGFDAVCLLGVSDLDFIVEHACEREGLAYRRAATSPAVAGGTRATTGHGAAGHGAAGHGVGRSDAAPAFLLHSERAVPPSGRHGLEEIGRAIEHGAGEAYLSEVLI